MLKLSIFLVLLSCCLLKISISFDSLNVFEQFRRHEWDQLSVIGLTMRYIGQQSSRSRSVMECAVECGSQLHDTLDECQGFLFDTIYLQCQLITFSNDGTCNDATQLNSSTHIFVSVDYYNKGIM